MDRIFQKRGYERDKYLFRTVIKSVKSDLLSFFTFLQENFYIRLFLDTPRFFGATWLGLQSGKFKNIETLDFFP